jgi:activator of HSP90 ATPase
VKIKPQEGSMFSMFSGNVTGEIISLLPSNKIVQKWRFQSWPEGTLLSHSHFSKPRSSLSFYLHTHILSLSLFADLAAKGHYSRVTYELANWKSGCRVTLLQEGVPSDDVQRTDVGWRQHFWEPFRILFGPVRVSNQHGDMEVD